MYIYNVTVTLEKEIQSEWLRWMKEIHIPDVMRTGFFIENKIVPKTKYCNNRNFRKIL